MCNNNNWFIMEIVATIFGLGKSILKLLKKYFQVINNIADKLIFYKCNTQEHLSIFITRIVIESLKHNHFITQLFQIYILSTTHNGGAPKILLEKKPSENDISNEYKPVYKLVNTVVSFGCRCKFGCNIIIYHTITFCFL